MTMRMRDDEDHDAVDDTFEYMKRMRGSRHRAERERRMRMNWQGMRD
jgi:hypothetical protein